MNIISGSMAHNTDKQTHLTHRQNSLSLHNTTKINYHY